jgi:hypothetical protein
MEHGWRDLKRHYLAHQTFTSVEQLDAAIHQAVSAMNQERSAEVCDKLRIAA